jgi:hypothetical protein
MCIYIDKEKKIIREILSRRESERKKERKRVREREEERERDSISLILVFSVLGQML